MRIKNYSFITIFCLVTLMAFQNCGRSDLQFEDLESTAEAKFFSYPYSSAPKYYMDLMLFKPSNQSNLNQFKVLAIATYVDQPTANVQYEIKIATADGLTICPTQTGTLTGGGTSVEFDCVSMRNANEIIATMTVTTAGFQQVIQKKYH